MYMAALASNWREICRVGTLIPKQLAIYGRFRAVRRVRALGPSGFDGAD
jgi:hypothetical protein